MGAFDDFIGKFTSDSNEPITDENGETLDQRLENDNEEFKNFLERSEQTRIKAAEQGINLDEVPEGFVSSKNPGGFIEVTDQVKAAAPPTRNYEWFYGEPPELSWFSSVGATLGDIFNPSDMPNASQKERDTYKEELSKFDEKTKKIYEDSVEYTLPEAELLGVDLSGMADDEFFSDGKVRIYKYLDDNDEVSMVLVPNPKSNAFQRVIGQAGRTIFTELVGLVERDSEGDLDLNYLEDSEYSKKVPKYDLSAGENLLTDLLVFGIPGVGAERFGRKTTSAGIDILKDSNVGKKVDGFVGTGKVGSKVKSAGNVLDNAISYAGGSLAIALTEGVLSEEGDKGLIFDSGEVQKLFTGLDDEEAADLAMIFDGFVINGAFDTILGLGSKAIKAGKKYVGGTRGFVDKSFVKDNAKRAALLGVLTEIDPSLVGKSGKEIAEATRTLAKILDSNATQLAKVGESTVEVPVDTVNALASGAKKYIEVTRQSLQNTMSPENWKEYVENEANLIVANTIGIARGNLDNAALRSKQASMTTNIASAFDKEADRINPDGLEFSDTADDLVRNTKDNLEEINAEILTAENTSKRFLDESGTAVSKDPFISQLISEVDPSRFFNDTAYIQELTNLYGKVFVDEYSSAYKAVREAYEAIPNDPIDMISFKTQLANVFTSTGGLGEITQDSLPILSKIKQVFGDKITAKKVEGSDELTPQQLIDGLSDDLGFQDLYLLKRELDQLITSSNNRNVTNSLTALRQHITSKAVDASGEATGQLAYVLNNGGKAAELAQAADDLFIKTQSKFQNADVTRRLSESSFTPVYRGSKIDVPPGGKTKGQPDLETTSVASTAAMLTDATGNQLEQLQFALSDALSKGEVNKPFIDLFVAKQTDLLAKALRNNDDQTIQLIDDSFESVIGELRRLDSPLVEELNAAKSRILKIQDELGSRALAAEEIARLAKLRKADAENTIVNKLMSNYSKGSKSTPTMTIRNLISSDDAGGAIDSLMKEIDKLPVEQQVPARIATQSMLLRTIKDLVTTATDIAPGGQKDVALGSLAKLTNERASGLIDAVSRAFPDNEYMKELMLNTLGGLQDATLGARMKIARAGSDTVANAGVRDSVSTSILFVFGYMNPTAAAARRLTATQINAMENLAKEEQDKLIGIILTEPEEFAELARLIANGVDPSTLSILRDNILNSVGRTGQYEFRVDESSNDDEQTTNMLLEGANNIKEGYNTVKDVVVPK